MLAVDDAEQLPVAAARAGSAGAWEILFRRYQLPLYSYVMELLHHEQTALDVVQEAFISATRHLGSLRDHARFGSWLFGIAHQKCQQHWRKAGREEPLDETFLEHPDVEPLPAERLERGEDFAALMAALDQLSPPHRAVLLLHGLEEFSLEEIADITGASLGTVKSRLHYARKQARELLMERTR